MLLGNNSLWPNNLYYQRVSVPTSRAITLFSSPLTIQLRSSGFVPIVIMFHVRKETGAYTLNGSTALQIKWINPPLGNEISHIGSVGFLDNASALTSLSFGPGGSGTFLFSLLGVVDTVAGADFALSSTIANLSGSGGNLDITIAYNLIPLKFFM